MDIVNTFPTVDANRVLELSNEYNELQKRRYDSNGEVDFDIMDEQSSTVRNLDKLITGRVVWRFDYMGHLPSGGWNERRYGMDADVFAGSRYYVELSNGKIKKYPSRTIVPPNVWHCDGHSVSVRFIDGEDDGYPTEAVVDIPLWMLVENDEEKLKACILDEAKKKLDKYIYELDCKYECEKACDRLIAKMMDKEKHQ